MYSALNASDEVFNEAYYSSKARGCRSVGERSVIDFCFENVFLSVSIRLHNYSTRSDSLDLRVVDVPKLICTTYQLKEQMTKIREEQQEQQQTTPFLTSNGDISGQQQLVIRNKIDELEQELNCLRIQLAKLEHS